ncbi:MAG: hypothetical protein MUF80_01615 [Burkholderiales bacterium]|jgi:hypothetical protein|nr:hypothetical protein [Burkholderiales bacterium]
MKDPAVSTPGRPSTGGSLDAWVRGLVATSMVLLAPAVAADRLECDVAGRDGQSRYLIDIDDGGGTVTVTDAHDRPLYVTVQELTSERILLAFNSLRLDATQFVRGGRVVSLALTISSGALIDRSTNTMVAIGYVTDDKGERLSLETLRAMQQEEEVRLREKKRGPNHNPMFWMMLEVATYRLEGTCRPAPAVPGD